MISVLIGLCTVVLILVALMLIGVVLMQRASTDAGMSAMGGGMMESTFGPDTTNVLSGLTIKLTVAFFVLSFMVYLGYSYQRNHASSARGALPNISAPAAPAAKPQEQGIPKSPTPGTTAPEPAKPGAKSP